MFFLPYRSILQIFVHILKGEKIINEAIAKEKEEQLKNPTARAPAGSSGLHGAHSIPAASGSSQGPAADESARLAVLLASMSEGMDAEIERALQEPTPQPRTPADQSMAAAARAGDRMAANAAAALAANGASQQVALAQPQLVAAPAPAPVPAPMVPEPNPESVQLLMDMGFPRERCVEAIRNTTTLDQATEYLLNNPVAPPSVVQPIQPEQASGQPSSAEGQLLLAASAAGTDSSQQSQLVARGAATSVPQMDDDLRRAIEMSLQEDPRPADQDAAPTHQEQETQQAAPQEPSGIPALPNFGSQSAPAAAEAAAVQHVAAWAPVGAAAPLAVRAVPAERAAEVEQGERANPSLEVAAAPMAPTASIELDETLAEILDYEPLAKEVIDDFTNQALSGCLNLLDTLPDTIYKVCDLLLEVFRRNGPDFKENVLRTLVEEVHQAVDMLSGNLKANIPSNSTYVRGFFILTTLKVVGCSNPLLVC